MITFLSNDVEAVVEDSGGAKITAAE